LSEKAVLVGLDLPNEALELSASLDELERLAETAGLTVIGRVTQKLSKPHPRHYLGKGKLHELVETVRELKADVVIVDDELRPQAQLELERELQVKVIDRTLLILDVFARHARTHEGRVQVELAQHQYMLPRLVGKGTELSRLGGGIGTRGPGETKLEFDRRRIRQRIAKLQREIDAIRSHRQVQRTSRQAKQLPVVAIVGYTNAGKSTLLNRLTGSEVEVADKLFATLDPTTRRLALPAGQEVLVTDTVGFISKLPTALVAAFRATLEELQEADLLLHVVDITDAHIEESVSVVNEILAELKLDEKPVLTVLNKADGLVLEQDGADSDPLSGMAPESLGMEPVPNTVLASATRGWGIEALKQAIEGELNLAEPQVEVTLPYSASDLVDLFHRRGVVESEEHRPEGTTLRGRIAARYLAPFEPFLSRPARGSGGRK
jgi:GTPase